MTNHGIARDQLRAFIERIERVEQEIAELNTDKRDIYAEAKSVGFDVPTIKKVVRLRKLDANERAESDALLDTYLVALGMAPDFDAPSRVHVHVRGEVDADTGEIHEPQPSPTAGQAAVSAPMGTAAVNQPETANELPPASRGIAGEDDLRELAATVPGRIAQEGDAPLEVVANANDEGMSGHAAHLSTEFAAPQPPRVIPGPSPDAAFRDPLDWEDEDGARPVDEIMAERGIVRSASNVIYEKCPPEPVRWHEYANCFSETSIEIGEGIDRPIVKIGNQILDGRSRYHAARDAGLEYPVVQYSGSDPLADVIRWNVESRAMSDKDKRAVARRLAQIEPGRADEIMEMFGLAEFLEAAQ